MDEMQHAQRFVKLEWQDMTSLETCNNGILLINKTRENRVDCDWIRIATAIPTIAKFPKNQISRTDLRSMQFHIAFAPSNQCEQQPTTHGILAHAIAQNPI
jgi:hypothetical protein